MPAQTRIQPCPVAGRDGVEHQERSAAVERRGLGGAHQGRAQPLPAHAAVHEHLHQIGPVRLIFGQIQHQLDGTAHAARVFGDEQRALAARHAVCHSPPERERLVTRHRLHEAHRRATLHAVHEHVGQAGQGGRVNRIQPPDRPRRVHRRLLGPSAAKITA
jgi:hypothetical protein